MVFKREILYPIFLACCKYTTDTFWKGIFEDLAYGQSPLGTYIYNGYLSCKIKGKEFNYKFGDLLSECVIKEDIPGDRENIAEIDSEDNIEEGPIKKLYLDVYTFLNKKVGLISDKEYSKRLKNLTDIENNLRKANENWAKIRKKNIKELILEKYIIHNVEKYSLGYPLGRKLLSFIYLSFQFKYITNNDIVFEKGKIEEINGISFDEGEVIISDELLSFMKIEELS